MGIVALRKDHRYGRLNCRKQWYKYVYNLPRCNGRRGSVSNPLRHGSMQVRGSTARMWSFSLGAASVRRCIDVRMLILVMYHHTTIWDGRRCIVKSAEFNLLLLSKNHVSKKPFPTLLSFLIVCWSHEATLAWNTAPHFQTFELSTNKRSSICLRFILHHLLQDGALLLFEIGSFVWC